MGKMSLKLVFYLFSRGKVEFKKIEFLHKKTDFHGKSQNIGEKNTKNKTLAHLPLYLVVYHNFIPPYLEKLEINKKVQVALPDLDYAHILKERCSPVGTS